MDSIGVDGDGRVYVAPSVGSSPQIQVFSSDGKPLGTWRWPDSVHSLDFTVGQDGAVYLLDLTDLRTQVVKADHEGRLLLRFAAPGQAGERGGPTLGMAVDGMGTVYLINTHGRFDKFASSGRHLSSWTARGEGQLRRPTEMTVDPDGNVYVIDGCSVIKFDPSGHFLKRWGPFRWLSLEDLDGSAVVPRIFVPSNKEMYLLFLPRSGSCPVVERRSQRDGRVLARWIVK